jgi:glycine cleavage system aminomethyltransferase T
VDGRAPDEYLVVFNAANRQKDLDWFHRWRRAWGLSVQVDDQTEQTVMPAVQEPQATARLSALLNAPLAEVPRFGATSVEWDGAKWATWTRRATRWRRWRT